VKSYLMNLGIIYRTNDERMKRNGDNMKTIKIRRKIRSTLLKIKELDQFKGKNIELEIKVKEIQSESVNRGKKSLAGALSQYADANFIEKERNAWALAVKEQNENYRR
jgi:hypothetical protein